MKCGGLLGTLYNVLSESFVEYSAGSRGYEVWMVVISVDMHACSW